MNSKFVKQIVYPLHEKLFRRPTFNYLEVLNRSQYFSREKLEEMQRQKLGELLEVAYQNAPWHRERLRQVGIDAKNCVEITFDDFRAIPTMDKQDAIKNRRELVWEAVPNGAQLSSTGGSSGEPLKFYFGRTRQASDAAGRMRARKWWGVDVGEREIYLWGAPVELNKSDRLRAARDRLVNHYVLNAFNMTPETMESYVHRINSLKPSCIYGYASSLTLLASFIKENVGRFKGFASLKVVCTTGEALYPFQRALIAEAFKVPVANEFGSRDIGFTAHESPEGQILQLSESIILEVLRPDGSHVAAGEMGEAVLTGLHSEAQPFIRYRTGDMVVASNEHCEAGRGLHVLGEINGRETDMLVKPDGTITHALAAIYVFREIAAVKEFRFVQHTLTEFEAIVIPRDDWRDDDQQAILSGLKSRLGDKAHITICLVEELPEPASGKLRQVESKIPLPNGLTAAQRQ